MPRTRSLAWSELKIGILTIIALGITVLTIFLLTGSGLSALPGLTELSRCDAIEAGLPSRGPPPSVSRRGTPVG